MLISMTAQSKLTMEVTLGNPKPELKTVDVALVDSEMLDLDKYHTGKGYPNNDGCKSLIQCFIQGIIACVKNGHQEGYLNEVEAIKGIVEELGRLFAAPTTNDTAEM